jgi:hypothetical protein
MFPALWFWMSPKPDRFQFHKENTGQDQQSARNGSPG